MLKNGAGLTQMSLPDFDHPSLGLHGSSASAFANTSPQDNFLFAIYPPDEVSARCCEIAVQRRQQDRLNVNVRPKAVLHATLCVLKSADCVTMAARVAEAVAASAFDAAFDVEFDCALSFDRHSGEGRRYPYVLSCGPTGNRALHRLQVRLSTPLSRMGLVVRSGFTPHLTLLYSARRMVRCAIEPVRWTVTEFALIHSHFGESRHEKIRCWTVPTTKNHA